MSAALPPRDRDEEPDPPRPGESRSAWVERMAREVYGLQEVEAAKERRRHMSFEDRLDAIWAGRDPNAREPGEDD